ncbi:hypothetical protein [Gimesia sp.]|uniref:hypothetical protein n=1 Tax=Gimesia sp. TaxID=2024833 RepID=UPI003A90F89E
MKPLALLALYFVLIFNFNTLPAAEPPNIIAFLTDEPDYDANNPLIRDGQPETESEYLTDAFSRETVSFIDRHHGKPFSVSRLQCRS